MKLLVLQLGKQLSFTQMTNLIDKKTVIPLFQDIMGIDVQASARQPRKLAVEVVNNVS